MAPDGTAFVASWLEDSPLRNVIAARIPAGGSPEVSGAVAADAMRSPSAAGGRRPGRSALVAFARGAPDAGADHGD